MTTIPKVIPVPYGTGGLKAALLTLKGSEKGAATFEAAAPLLSAMLVSGGTKVELSGTTATVEVFRMLHSESLKTPTAKAFRACCARTLSVFSATGRSKDQDSHDSAMLALSAEWAGFFRDATVKVKPEGYEAPTATIARLRAELATMTAERDALRLALAPAPAPAPAPVMA